MLKSLPLLVILLAGHAGAMFEAEINNLNGGLNYVNSIRSVPNAPANGYKEINNAFQNSGSFAKSMANDFNTGNVIYSTPNGGSYDSGNMVYGHAPVVAHAAAVRVGGYQAPQVYRSQPVVVQHAAVQGYQAPQTCRIPQDASFAYYLQSQSYGYPKREIYNELYNRPQVRAAILKIKQAPTQTRAAVYSGGSANAGGCKPRSLNLGRFYAYGARCWVINPAYQKVAYVSCGKGCGYDVGYGSRSVCAGYHVQTYVWSYCSGLRYGARIQLVSIPLPQSCSCKTYQCD